MSKSTTWLAEINRKQATYQDLLSKASPAQRAELEFKDNILLTYHSNAIEGNDLSFQDTLDIISHGYTIGGKSLIDHMEALDHYKALEYIRESVKYNADRPYITEAEIRTIHGLVTMRSDPKISGRYAVTPRLVETKTGTHIFPAPAVIPSLMESFAAKLKHAPLTPATAFAAHHDLACIHPFDDGNGRTARLLMNFILIGGGWPPVLVRVEDRDEYLDALNISQSGFGMDAFTDFMYDNLNFELESAIFRLKPTDESGNRFKV
jgi:Fic family protein